MDTAYKPWLFLDVDGVLIPGGIVYSADKWDEKGDPDPADHIRCEVTHERMGRIYAFIPTRMADHLKELEKHYDIVWATSWSLLARDLEKALGIEAYHCLEPSMSFGRGSLKGDAVANFLLGYDNNDEWDANPVENRLRPFAWADDKLKSYVYALDDLADRSEWLAIPCNEKTGITGAQVAALLAFAKAL